MLYLFFPGAAAKQLVTGDAGDKLNAEFFAAIPGLSELLAGVADVPRQAMATDTGKGAGPGGQSGAVLTLPPAGRVVDHVGNAPGRQHWIDCGGWWLGCMKDAPPTAADLERATQVPGYLVADPTGQQWRIPVARAPGHRLGTLPQFFTFGADGLPVAHVQESHLWLWELSGQIAEAYARGDVEFSQLVLWSLKVLQVNYRIDRNVVNLLAACGRGLLTQATIHAICQAVYGMEIEEEIKKKYLPENSEGGPSQTPQS